LWQHQRLHRVAAQLKSAAPSGVLAVAEGTQADMAVVARSDPGATVMVVIAGGRHMRGRAMEAAMARASRVNTPVAGVGDRTMLVIAVMPTATAGRNRAVVSVGDRSTLLAIAVMLTATA